MQCLVLRVAVFGPIRRRGFERAHQRAGIADQPPPRRIADRAQRLDRIADAEVVGRLLGVLLQPFGGNVGVGLAGPLVPARTWRLGRILLPLRQSKQECAAHAARAHRREQPVEIDGVVAIDMVRHAIRHFACRRVGGDPFGEPAQVLDQDDPQRGRQRPEFAEGEIALLLIGHENGGEQVGIERAVVVGDERPGHAVNARQTRQMGIDQHRQVTKVAAGEPVVDLLQLRVQQMKVVQQPFACRRDAISGSRRARQIAVGLAQNLHVLMQTWKERGVGAGADARVVRLCQAGGVLPEALKAEDLGTDRRLQQAPRRIQQRDAARGGFRHQAAQPVPRHALHRQRDHADDDRGQHQGREGVRGRKIAQVFGGTAQ